MERSKTKTKAPDARDVEVGRRIRSQRLVSRMSQTELANNLGVTFQQVQKYEKGVNRVGAGRLSRIADVLSVPVSFFFSGDISAPSSSSATTGLSFLETAGAVRLVRAYSTIEDPDPSRTRRSRRRDRRRPRPRHGQARELGITQARTPGRPPRAGLRLAGDRIEPGGRPKAALRLKGATPSPQRGDITAASARPLCPRSRR